MTTARPRLIAFYLPQFHPIKENDAWWGKGFTEWTNTAKAKPRFRGHYQPHVPADLGYYDLRLPDVRREQAEMAQRYGIEGFCYYHYWFGSGRRLLERPFSEVVASGQPDYPFCLCWANHSWTGIWWGAADRMLMKQEYPGAYDDERHFEKLIPEITDKSYMTVDGRPIFDLLSVGCLIRKQRCGMAACKIGGLPGLHLLDPLAQLA
jgi:lipopolysaccharide biosynthesis protein